MSIFDELILGFESGQRIFDQALIESRDTRIESIIKVGKKSVSLGEIVLADNIKYMAHLINSGFGDGIKLIYVDPPFFSKSKYNAVIDIPTENNQFISVKHMVYDDRFERNLSCYIENLSARLMMMYDLLKADGFLFVHLDWHSSHYVRLILDEIFGSENFVNEIIWQYKSGGSSDRHFSRKHDSILVYSKRPGVKLNIPTEKSYNRGFKPYNFDGVKEYQDEIGYYTLVKMRDVWAIDMVGRTSTERTGYATQKPGELVARIVEAASSPGDLCADFFAGSGTLAYEAARLGRRFLSCDNEEIAINTCRSRLESLQGLCFDIKALDREFIYENCISFVTTHHGFYHISRFEPVIDMGNIKIEGRLELEHLIKTNPLDLIEAIYIDQDYYKTDHDFSPDVKILNPAEDFAVPDPSNALAIIIDRFGKHYFANFK